MKLSHAVKAMFCVVLLEGCVPTPVRSVNSPVVETYSTPAPVYYSTPGPVVVTPAPVYVAPRGHYVTHRRVIHRPVVIHRRVVVHRTVHRTHKKH
jgi:hypothetical protein